MHLHRTCSSVLPTRVRGQPSVRKKDAAPSYDRQNNAIIPAALLLTVIYGSSFSPYVFYLSKGGWAMCEPNDFFFYINFFWRVFMFLFVIESIIQGNLGFTRY